MNSANSVWAVLRGDGWLVAVFQELEGALSFADGIDACADVRIVKYGPTQTDEQWNRDMPWAGSGRPIRYVNYTTGEIREGVIEE